MKPITVLVTGGAGYIGSVLVPMLLKRGYHVRVLDRLLFGGNGIMMCNAHPNFQFIKGDIRDFEDLKKAMHNMDYIVHLAAIVGYPACRQNPDLANTTNVDAIRHMMVLRENQKILFASTGSVYGKVDGICTEESPTNPLSLYGENKLEGERLLLNPYRSVKSIVYRFATAYGISPRLRLDLMPNDFVYQAVKRRTLVVYEKNFRRTFIHVRDMAKSFIHGIECFATMKGQVFNVGCESQNFTKEEICMKIKKHKDYYLHFADYDGDKDKRDYEVSYEKIKKTGFKTAVTIDQGIKELVKSIDMIKIKNPYNNAEE